MQLLILVRGLPGSGKSTLAKKLCQQCAGVHLEADMFFTDSNDENYQFNANQLSEAHAWCQSQTVKALKKGKTVVISNTFVQKWEIVAYQKIAKQLSIGLKIYECYQQFDSIHHVPSSKIKQMSKRWFTLSGELKQCLENLT
ncbi:ATP-binding protein [Vibrio sp. B1Z05]|uniref:ATP-binding protein n=1 Tax=Vibrio sp. B1Z05 TaxID=2654980 RepID=UPI00128B7D1A|nr:ATP-binding protein [Vibrio sp. B1Z05]MPW36574.1 AAA family ATPase [Vibrio sp. B1Z05]